MRKSILTALFCLGTLMSWAVKADPTPVTVIQPDGTQITVIGHGDENCHWFTTTDGAILVRQGVSYYVANINADGSLSASRQLAHEMQLRSSDEKAMVKAQDKQAFLSTVEARMSNSDMRRIGIGTATPAYFPHTGSPKALVILVDFTDTPFTVEKPNEIFNDYLNAEGAISDYKNKESRNYGSVGKYFKDMSNGQFAPQFDVVGPVHLQNDLKYYGGNSGNSDNMSRIYEMIEEACEAVNGEVDFSQYDQNNDGEIDLVYIIYSGFSESVSGNSSDCIWPKSGTMTSSKDFDGKKLRRYGTNNELNYYPDYNFSSNPEITRRINGIGLFCHEFSHTMGLPDLYYNKPISNQTMEYWDLMDGGEYTDNGYTPTPYTPWEREVMGWTTIEELSAKGKVTLNTDEYRKVTADGSEEYIILHNVQNTGWARRLLGHGMMVYRIDYPKDIVNMGDNPNRTDGKPAVTVVPADGLLISSYQIYSGTPTETQPYSQKEYIDSHYGDPYPGTGNVTELLTVNLNESVLEKPIYNITEDNGVITFDFLEKSIPDAIESVTTISPESRNKGIYTIDGRYAGYDETNLPKGIYIVGNKKVVKNN